MVDEYLLVLAVPDSLKDDVVDALMTLPEISGFTLTKAAGYSREHSHFDLREQVEGYRDFYRFEIIYDQAGRNDLFDAISSACGKESVRYWISPLFEQGHLPLPG